MSSITSVIIATTLAALIKQAYSASIYVSPTGSGSGTIGSLYGSIQTAVNAAKAGDVIYLRVGTYSPTTNIQITKSGTVTSPTTLRPYNDEKVIIDGEGLPGTPYGLDESLPNDERCILHIEGGNY
ncbi:pectin lyase fold/virulence factor [Xylaria acuta]|nr:pectin lyase fold/virulence factor [Xylaria acuta]